MPLAWAKWGPGTVVSTLQSQEEEGPQGTVTTLREPFVENQPCRARANGSAGSAGGLAESVLWVPNQPPGLECEGLTAQPHHWYSGDRSSWWTYLSESKQSPFWIFETGDQSHSPGWPQTHCLSPNFCLILSAGVTGG